MDLVASNDRHVVSGWKKRTDVAWWEDLEVLGNRATATE
jgi:hypothetical protein